MALTFYESALALRKKVKYEDAIELFIFLNKSAYAGKSLYRLFGLGLG